MDERTKYAVERAIENILSNTNKNTELSHQVALELASLDWKQVLLQQQQKEISSQMWAMQDFIEWRERGGGFCDECQVFRYEGGYRRGEMYEKVYSWPHSITPYYESIDEAAIRHYCWEHFHKMQVDTEIALIRKQNKENTDPQKYNFSQWEKLMEKYKKCERLIPRRAGYSFAFGFYCIHCVEQAIKRQFIHCQICNKKTASFMNGYCYDCYPIYRNLGAQVAQHLQRAVNANTPATLTLKQWAQAIAYFGQRCAYCQIRPFQVLEHFHPIALGGGTTEDNCVPACKSCNSKKGGAHSDRLHLIFPKNTIERIQNYLQNEKLHLAPQPVTGRELVVLAS